MDQYQSMADGLAAIDLSPPPIVYDPAMSCVKLSADILLLVFEPILAQKHPKRPFSDMRLVSKRFNRLVTPLAYRHILLNNNIILSLMPNENTLAPHELQVAQDVRECTQHVTLKGNFSEDHLRVVFESLRYIRDVT